ncbi:MAG TPA: hypothetical protein VFG42_22495 [Baekduia sp.]|uniref:hypothetical protein n=1 Tax=Baekduia sp. TaxID=2600305 RepID=UPI002D77FCED|nr:hypothetical protein [Baekduia sp.]HET6509584.1 hypothetical protein [Baekduia sp.]
MIGSSPRRLLTVFAAGAAVVVLAFVALVALHHDDSSSVDCDTFRVTPALWSKADYDRRVQLLDGLRDCHQIQGRSDTDVVATLGPPDRDGLTEIDYDLPYGRGSTDRQVWRIHLDADHRVRSTTLESPQSGTP